MPELDAPSRLRTELWRGLGALASPPGPPLKPLAEALDLGPLPDRAEHTDLFVLQLPPYASIYLGAEGMLGGEARERIAGFWSAVGRTPPREPDHLAFLLGLYGALGEEVGGGEPAGAPLVRHAREALLREHLSCWLFPYLLKAEEVASAFYRRWAALLRQALEEEMTVEEMTVAHAGSEDPTDLPVHLAQAPPPVGSAPGPDGTEEEGHDPVAHLLVPVRTGMILTRADFVRASRDRDLPVRIGERRFALRGMLSAEPEGTLQWLADEAEGWVGRHARWEATGRPAGGAAAGARVGATAAGFWRDRARATAEALRELGGE